jgi:Arc/MetJ family transcription regulator
MGRTNIVIDDELVMQAMKLTGATTKREVVDIALRSLVSRADVYKALRKMRGQADWDGDLDAWRRSSN